jgi:D-glycero-D-manno-heptose 1,7-bisphosphate phosphatase
MTSKAVFLDKDGTLIEDVPYNIDTDLIQLASGAQEALNRLQDEGYQLIIVTNQSGVARGFFKERDLKGVASRISEMLSSAGISLTDFYYCPHYPHGKSRKYVVDCFCRKPQPGMIYRAALEHDIDLSASWMVGDILNDIEAGNRAGCRTILINNHHETEWDLSPVRQPEFVVNNLKEAANVIASASLEVRTLGYVEQE